jgi:hypothetical protein
VNRHLRQSINLHIYFKEDDMNTLINYIRSNGHNALFGGGKTLFTLSLLMTVSIPIQAQAILKAPFGCAQTWDAWTYSSHNDIDSLDFALWKDRTKKDDPVNENISYGQFVLASAAGEVTKDDVLPDDEWGLVRRVTIDHANDMSSVYLHNVIEPNFLPVGRKVAMGEVIGIAGRSGTGPRSWHIHYSQKDNDDIVRSRFDGVGVQTHGGNPDMIGLGGSDRAERIRSSNCTARKFATWRTQGDTYIMRYHPEKGQARITRLAQSNGSPSNTWSSNEGVWGKSFTEFLSYKINDVPHILRYNPRSGRATFYKVQAGGSGLERIGNSVHWRKGWTLMQSVNHEDLNFVLAYDSRTGYRQFLQLSPDGSSAAVDDTTFDSTGWTHVLGFDRNGQQYLLFYKASSGQMKIRRMDRVTLTNSDGELTNRISIELHDVYSKKKNPGWTHLQLMRQQGKLYLVGFKAKNGKSAIWEIDKPRNGPQKTANVSLNRKWDIMTSVTSAGDHQLLMYGVDFGDTRIFTLNADGSGLSAGTQMNWEGGWR